jgi:Ni/Co efflux regulator RcnB
MDVEIEMYIDEDDETLVMQKVSSLTKQAKDAGFKIGEIEFKRSRHKDKEDKHHHHHHHNNNNNNNNKHHNENSSDGIRKDE